MQSPGDSRRGFVVLQRDIISPVDGALFRCVHVLAFTRLEQERFHVSREERSRLRIHHVQSIVIDQHGLLLQPLSPAVAANLTDDARTDCAGKRWTLESFTRLAAATAGYIGHDPLLGDADVHAFARILHFGESEQRKQLDVPPADIELEPAMRELSRVRIGVMVVVQFLTAQPDGDR